MMCVCTRSTLCMCIHVCIESITYTARLMWKSCSEPGFYLLFIISLHNVGNKTSEFILGISVQDLARLGDTGGGAGLSEGELGHGCKIPVCHLLPFVSTHSRYCSPACRSVSCPLTVSAPKGLNIRRDLVTCSVSFTCFFYSGLFPIGMSFLKTSEWNVMRESDVMSP